jgi:hypothetical protein
MLSGDDVATILAAAASAKVKRIRFGDLYVEFDSYVELPLPTAYEPAKLDPQQAALREELARENELSELVFTDMAEFERRAGAVGDSQK